MNKIIIIGNLTANPVAGATPQGVNFSKFSVAVNRGKDKPAEFFRVTAWRALGDTCQKYLEKGRKVCVVGSATAYAWQGQDGKIRGEIQVDAQDVEFLGGRGDAAGDGAAAPVPDAAPAPDAAPTDPSGMTPVENVDDLPF